MKRKKINYDEIINKLDDYLKKKDDKYILVVIYPNGAGYKIQESNGVNPREFYINSDKELDEYLKDKRENTKCHIIKCNIV